LAERVLVVDDDRKTVDLVRLYLERAGYSVQVAHDGRQALDLARGVRPHLVVLDLMLPHLDGLDVCHVVRQELGAVPIIMLTARTTEADKLLGLESGADDYVTKPFSPRELVARVKAVLRRTGAAGAATTRDESRFGQLVIDHRRLEARRCGVPLRLTPREFRLIETLAREPDRPISRQGLADSAFGLDYEGLERTVDAHVANLRRKIEPNAGRPIYVLTVPGVGYKLARRPAEEEVQPTDAPSGCSSR
jgi:DNA-binding response OmpR family regulator